MELSTFGRKFSGYSGIVELMDDLGEALEENPGVIMMGGGNPGRVREAEDYFRRRLEQVLADDDRRHRLFGLYQVPAGDLEFRRQVADYLKRRFGWRLGPGNIALSNGSQPAYFVLLNLFAGEMPDGSRKTIHLPLTPEYLGYADAGLNEDFFSATRPEIERLDETMFKYRVDFSRLDPKSGVGALCVSRPTNPTGNVLTDPEMAHLDEIARHRGIPLIIDAAYGLPFPGIQFGEAEPLWNENIVLTLSLSKLGLPGVRTGIIVAREDIISAYATANGIVNLACGNLGPVLAGDLLTNGGMESLVSNHVRPFYQRRAQAAVDACKAKLEGLPFRIHKPEGAFFLWLWFEGLPVSSQELYQRLKRRGVLVVPGHHCFLGLDGSWAHSRECIRVSYVQDPGLVREGIGLIAEELRELYG
jgi:valine--pyruvate aminotransferase